MEALKISIYSDGQAQYRGRQYRDAGALLEVLNSEHGESASPLVLAYETPGDFDAVGRIIYGLQRAGSGARLVTAPGAVVDPR